MQLTNFSFLNARNEFLSSIAKRKVASDRIETGKRLEQSTKDLGAISQASKQKLQMINDRASINNLKNLRSFLYSQEVSLHRVYEMYDKIEQLAIKAANPVTTSEERKDYQLEFEDYQKQLENLMASRYQERLLFSSTEKCGGSVDVVLKELNMDATSKKGGASHAIRAQTVETGSPSGKVSFRVNSGGAGDTYRVWMGDICVFSAGPEFQGDDYTKNYNDNGPITVTYNKADGTPVSVETEDISFPFSGRGWATSGTAGNGDDDLFEVSFGPGEETTYTVTLGGSNDANGDGISDRQTAEYDPATGKYSNIITKDLPITFDQTEMTLQVETDTIGVIYEEGGSSGSGETADGLANSGVQFTPTPFIREIPVDTHNPENIIYLDPKGFDTLDGRSIVLPDLAQEVVDVMRGNRSACGCEDYFGEMKCLLENRLGILGAEYKRVDQEIEELEDQLVTGEAAFGRIAGADMAAEATQFAKEAIKADMAVQVMSNTSRLKDVLIPLTTEHFRSNVLSAGI